MLFRVNRACIHIKSNWVGEVHAPCVQISRRVRPLNKSAPSRCCGLPMLPLPRDQWGFWIYFICAGTFDTLYLWPIFSCMLWKLSCISFVCLWYNCLMALFVCLRFSDCLVRVATEADSVHTAVRVLEAQVWVSIPYCSLLRSIFTLVFIL